MPGILPMKVIKVGSSAQSRIAQACDRCRSKKIRCDGIRPCCSQCANVGFECKTSDKLSRRAFPRGYTESLEERVRSLEAEVREFKGLVDEKDEKIDILSKIHPNSRPSTVSPLGREISRANKEEVFRVQASPLLFGSDHSDSYFMGASSGRVFIDAFKRKVQESGRSCAEFNTSGFLNPHDESPKTTTPLITDPSVAPSRLLTDRLVNVFFQEWAPLFPVLHKPTFLRSYEEFVESPEQTTDQHALAQLYLVFGLSELSGELPDHEQLSVCEARWRTALDASVKNNTLATLQCLILAQLFCIAKGDYKYLQHYKAIAVALSHRLGLNQSQKRFAFGALTIEARKRVFWSLYTVDCFSAASLGLPKLLADADAYAEYPNDVDDEYITEKGFQPTLPGESTKISSALALFKGSRILSKVLEKNYPASTSHDLSFASIAALEQELQHWYTNLPNHLKLTFIQNKPSTDVTGNRSPILSLTFHYIRTLIHRPVIGCCVSSRSSSSVIALADSSKHIIQIAQLLKERHLAFSLCLNKDEVMTLCGISLLYQRIDLKQDGKLMRDGQELVQEVIKSLAKSNASGASDFTRLAVSLGIEDPLDSSRTGTISGRTAPQNPALMPSPATAKMHQAGSNNLGRLTSDVTQHGRRATFSTDSMSHVESVSPSDLSNRPLDIDCSEVRKSPPRRNTFRQSTSPQLSRSTRPKQVIRSNRPRNKRPNLDYLSLSSSVSRSHTTSPLESRNSFQNHSEDQNNTLEFRPSTASKLDSQSQKPLTGASSSSPGWDNILGTVDEAEIFNAMYGGTSVPLSGDGSPSGSDSRSHTTSPAESHKSLPNDSEDQNDTPEFRPSTASKLHSQSPKLSNGASPSLPGWNNNVLGSVDEAQIYDAMYGGTSLPISLSSNYAMKHEEKYAGSTGSEWSPSIDGWDGATLSKHHGIDNASSVLSFSEESLSSGEELGDSSGGANSGIVVRGDEMDYEQLLLTENAHNVDDFQLDDDLSTW